MLITSKITGCILALNEERRIEDAIKSLLGWTCQIILIDNGSTDRTIAIAQKYGALILSAPPAPNFDAFRNLAIEHSIGTWIFYLDADERVPDRLGPILQNLVEERGHEFEALMIPFRTYFCGLWIQHSGWWPGYTRPQLLKKGHFHYQARLHSGVEVQGRTLPFPADDPELAILHYSFDDITHYLTKLNSYTDGEALNLDADDGSHSWQAQIAHFVHDWQYYYDRKQGYLDGMHGFELAYLSAVYRLLSRAKVWDLRRKRNEASANEPVPASIAEVLEFMAQVHMQGADRWLRERRTPEAAQTDAMSADTLPAEWIATSPLTAPKTPKTRKSNRSGITGCILARNEEKWIEDAIKSLLGWTCQIIVIDNGSTDRTTEIARKYGALILSAPPTPNFDALRNLAIEHSEGNWIFYLDADERVQERLGPILQNLVEERGQEFEALMIPFKTYVFGTWMQSPVRWPGYCRAQLVKKGAFRYPERLHSQVEVNGRTLKFPADDSGLAVVHHAFEDLHHYIAKLNVYTDQEAVYLEHDDANHGWQAQMAVFAFEWHFHYDVKKAGADGMPGFLLSFFAAFYRTMCFAKLWNRRWQQGETDIHEPVPGSLREILQYLAQVVRNGMPRDIPRPPKVVRRHPLVWLAPFFGTGDYAEAARCFALAFDQIQEPIRLLPILWGDQEPGIAPELRARLESRLLTAAEPAEIAVCQIVPGLQRPHPEALVNIARALFETDGLPPEAVEALNAMDRVWVPSEFNRNTFARSGVAEERLVVVPECIDPALYSEAVDPGTLSGTEGFKFLCVLDWARLKGWDVLIPAFAEEFGAETEVGLTLAVQNTLGRSAAEIAQEIDALLQTQIGKTLQDFPNIHVQTERLPLAALPGLYRAADAFVLPTRGEGWSRPLMEAMAAGLPTIATSWGGQTAFHTARLGYPLKYRLAQVAPEIAAETPLYTGHYIAEPDPTHLKTLMRRIVEEPDAARERGRLAQQHIAVHFSLEAIAAALQPEIAYCKRLAAQKAARSLPAPPSSTTAQTPDTVLVQCATGTHTRLLDLTRAHHEDYARAHGMDYICRYGPQQNERSPLWDKIPLLIDILKRSAYKNIIWLDADTLIVDPRQDLREALPDGAWLGMVQHGNPAYFNNGAMYLRNTPQALAFLEAVWNTWPIDHGWEDNAAVIKVLEQDPARRRGVAILDDAWNSTYQQNESPRPVVKAWHGYGRAIDRFAQMLPALQAALALLSPAADARNGAASAGSTAPAERPLPIRPNANPLPLDPIVPIDFRKMLDRPLRVHWEGDQTLRSSLGHVNRELCLSLLAGEDMELSLEEKASPWHQLTAQDDARFGPLFERIGAELSGLPDVTVRHRFPADWKRPAQGKFVMMQPWEASHLPGPDWIAGATHEADEVWANSRFVRDVYVRSGVPAEKIRVIPEGVRTDVFTPEGEKFPLATTKSVRFLFVGGALHRKGADLLLEAYMRTFTAADDVCLVVKDMATKTFYKGQTWAEGFRRAQTVPNAPEIIYMDDDLSEAQLASLYRACTCVVLPYRGEGFGLPPLEGMACGLPAIVTSGGSTDDYLDDSMALRVPYHRFIEKGKYVGPHAIDPDPWLLEPDLNALADALRWVRDHPVETRQRGEAARAHVLAGWTWERAGAIVKTRLQELVLPTSARPIVPAKLWKGAKSNASAGKKPRGRKKVELSLCMIARNEEARIKNCLESIAPHVDEMIVVDTGSTDRTREIAQACGAQVYDFPWVESFAEARNQSLAQANGSWIYWMDADDIISAECGRGLRELIRRHPDRNAAYQVQVRIPRERANTPFRR